MTKPPIAVDIEGMEAESKRFQQHFEAVLFWRDVREVGTALLLIPVWLFIGLKLALPWSWYLMVPALAWIAGYMMLARVQGKRCSTGRSDPLVERLERMQTLIEQQIWFLGNVRWWGLVPIGVPMMLFISHIAWLSGTSDWPTVLFVVLAALLIGTILLCLERVNQQAIHTHLRPEREKIKAQLLGLQQQVPDNSHSLGDLRSRR